VTFTIFYNITFIPESPNHRINGMLTFVSHGTIFYDTDPISGTGMAYGFGTGDLKGVTLQASKGPWMYDPDLGLQFMTTLEGTVTGWPTHLCKPK